MLVAGVLDAEESVVDAGLLGVVGVDVVVVESVAPVVGVEAEVDSLVVPFPGAEVEVLEFVVLLAGVEELAEGVVVVSESGLVCDDGAVQLVGGFDAGTPEFVVVVFGAEVPVVEGG